MESAWRNGVAGLHVLPNEDSDYCMRQTQRQNCKCIIVNEFIDLRSVGGPSEQISFFSNSKTVRTNKEANLFVVEIRHDWKTKRQTGYKHKETDSPIKTNPLP